MCEPSSEQETITVKEMQAILRISMIPAYNLVHSGKFPVIKVGRSYRIPKDSFYEWLRQNGAARH